MIKVIKVFFFAILLINAKGLVFAANNEENYLHEETIEVESAYRQIREYNTLKWQIKEKQKQRNKNIAILLQENTRLNLLDEQKKLLTFEASELKVIGNLKEAKETQLCMDMIKENYNETKYKAQKRIIAWINNETMLQAKISKLFFEYQELKELFIKSLSSQALSENDIFFSELKKDLKKIADDFNCIEMPFAEKNNEKEFICPAKINKQENIKFLVNSDLPLVVVFSKELIRKADIDFLNIDNLDVSSYVGHALYGIPIFIKKMNVNDYELSNCLGIYALDQEADCDAMAGFPVFHDVVFLFNDQRQGLSMECFSESLASKSL